MKVLGIETSCDETAVAILEVEPPSEVQPRIGFTVLSNIVSSQVQVHAPFGGVVPALAAREHAANIGHVYDRALKEAGITDAEREIDLLAVTRGPGLGPALLVGLTFARVLAMKWHKPIVGVDHMDGHIHSNWLPPAGASDALFPALNLLVSGGHTELVLMRGHGEYEILGRTLDDAVGEAFDKVARLLGLGYPGGPAISKLAAQGDADRYSLPRPMAKSKNLDFSYSGLKTAVLYLVRDLTDTNARELTGTERADIAASFQKAAVEVLVDKAVRAAQEYGAKAIWLSGGVSANRLLRERLHAAATELGVSYAQPDIAWTGDNAAMIAAAGYFQYQKNKTTDPFSWESVVMDANLRLGS